MDDLFTEMKIVKAIKQNILPYFTKAKTDYLYEL